MESGKKFLYFFVCLVAALFFAPPRSRHHGFNLKGTVGTKITLIHNYTLCRKRKEQRLISVYGKNAEIRSFIPIQPNRKSDVAASNPTTCLQARAVQKRGQPI